MSFLEIDCMDTSEVIYGEWLPVNDQELWFLFDVFVTAKDVEGDNRFWFRVGSPEAYERVKANGIAVTERGLYLVKHEDFSWQALEDHVRQRVAECDTGEWDSSIEKLRQVFNWEYEGFVRTDVHI